MFVLQLDNVVKITDDVHKRDAYIAKGFTLVEEETPKPKRGKKESDSNATES